MPSPCHKIIRYTSYIHNYVVYSFTIFIHAFCFASEQTKTLYKLSKSDPVKATRKAFDIIVDMQTASNKFHHLLCALKEADKLINTGRHLKFYEKCYFQD